MDAGDVAVEHCLPPPAPPATEEAQHFVSSVKHPGRVAKRIALAAEYHALLICRLGGKCARCGATERLEIDHEHGRDWDVQRLPPLPRVKRYWREFFLGVALRVLCRSCNGSNKWRRKS